MTNAGPSMTSCNNVVARGLPVACALIVFAAPSCVLASGNADLIGALKSDSFVNIATRGSANFDSNAQTTGSGGAETASIAYKSGTQGWTLSTNGGSITFLPSDIDASQSNSAVAVYLRRSGSTTDSLTITRGAKTGRFTYRYVGSAFWQHSQVGSTSGTGSLDAIAFGAATPLAGMPKTGMAYFDVDLLGVETTGGGPYGLTGQGSAAVDFAKGSLAIAGQLHAAYWGDGPFSAKARLTSGQNAFSGTISFGDGVPSTAR